jgi:glutamate decarboxylase
VIISRWSADSLVINLGFEGYRALAQTNLHNARVLSRALEAMGFYKVLSNIHRPKQQAAGGKKYDETDAEYYVEGLPVVSFCFTDQFKEKYPHIKQMWMQTQLRTIGWIVPK